MTLKNKATLLAALIGAGLIVLGTAWKERTKPEPTDYLTFEHVVYSGDSKFFSGLFVFCRFAFFRSLPSFRLPYWIKSAANILPGRVTDQP